MTEKPLRELHPVPVPAQFWIWGTIVSAVSALFPGFFVLVLSNIIAGFRNIDAEGQASLTPILRYGIWAYVLAFFLFMRLLYLQIMIAPSRTRYTIYPDRIECETGIWNRHNRTIMFDQVIDLELSEGVFQQPLGVGSITITTQRLVSKGEGKLGNLSIPLNNIPNPGEVYELLRSLAIERRGQT